LASLPPEVDVPLPLGFGFVELPVVGDVPGVAELAAGSPVVEPRPLGAPLCAYANVFASPTTMMIVATAILVSFMVAPYGRKKDNVAAKQRFRCPSGNQDFWSFESVLGFQHKIRTSHQLHLSATDLKRAAAIHGLI
jgi:hypothetical protein